MPPRPRRPAGMAAGISPLDGSPQSERGGLGPSSISGGGSFGSIDSSDLVTLSQNLRMVRTDIDMLAASVATLTTKLTAAASAANSAASNTGRIKGPGNLRSKPVAGGGSLTTGDFGGDTGSSGKQNRNTPGSFSGGATKAVGFGAAAEVTAGFAGQINSYVSGFKGSGTALDQQAGLSVALFGGNRSATANAYAQNVPSLSVADASKGVAGLQANPYLFTTPNSANGKQLAAFLKTANGLNPSLGAAGASQFANLLTSPQVMTLSNRFGGANGQGALLRPTNAAGGNGLGINTPQQTFSSLLKILTAGQTLTPAQMKSMAADTPRGRATWATITSNAMNPNSTSYIPGITTSDLTAVRQFAAAGGNVSQAQKAMSGTMASSNLTKTSSETQSQTSAFQNSEGAQKLENRATTDLNNWTKALINSQKWIAQLGVGGAAAVKALLNVASIGTGLLSLATAMKLKGLMGIGAGAAAEDAAAVGGGIAAGGVLGTAALGVVAAGSTYEAYKQINTLVNGQLGGGKQNGMISVTEAQQEIAAMKKAGIKPNAQTISAFNKTLNFPKGQYFNSSGTLEQGDPATGSTTTSGLQPNLAHGIAAMRAANPNLQITSGHRTSRQQANLYAMKGGHQVAKPGHSLHERGKAADIGPRSQLGWVQRNARKFGLHTPDRTEPWHVQAMGDPVATGTGVTGSAIVSAADKYLGTPYSWGGGNANGPTLGSGTGQHPYQATHTVGLDCSGLVVAAYASVGITMPRTAAAQSRVGTAIRGIGAAQPGDLIFYAGSDGSAENPGHVAIYVGGGKQIAAPETGTVVQIQNVQTGDIVGIRRIVHGGAGQAVANAASSAVGGSGNAMSGSSASVDATGLSGLSGVNVGLANTFIAQVGGNGWLDSIGTGSAPLTSNSLPGVGTLGTTGVSTGGSQAASSYGATGGGTGGYSASQAITNAVKAASANKQVQLAMLTGAVLESGNNPTSKGAGSYGAWQIQLNAHPGVTVQQAENPAWAAKFMAPSYAGALSGVPSSLWASNPASAAAQVAALAERPAHGSAPQSMAYINNEGPNVGPAYNTAVSEMGDPSGYRAPGGLPSNGVASFSPGGGGGTRNVVINLPVTVVGVSQQDAQMLANMVIQALKKDNEFSGVSHG